MKISHVCLSLLLLAGCQSGGTQRALGDDPLLICTQEYATDKGKFLNERVANDANLKFKCNQFFSDVSANQTERLSENTYRVSGTENGVFLVTLKVSGEKIEDITFEREEW